MSSCFAFLNRPTRLEAWTFQKLTALETYCHTRIRRGSFSKPLFALALLHASALAACTGLLISRTTSLTEASKFCQERFAIVLPKLTSSQEEAFENGSNSKLTPGVDPITVLETFFPPPSLTPPPLPNFLTPKQPR
jgi:hypothetical protein